MSCDSYSKHQEGKKSGLRLLKVQLTTYMFADKSSTCTGMQCSKRYM